MKRLLLFISTLLCANVLMAQTRFWIGDIYYEVTSTSPAEVKVYSSYQSSIVIADIPATVSYNGTNYSVTSIGYGAFRGCDNLTSVTIPNSVTSIGNDAFDGCSSLTSVTIPNSVTSIGDWAFLYCSSLTSVTIPNSVTSIGDNMFYWCSSLTSVTIPNSVTSIGERAFYYCSSLTSVTIPNSVTSIGKSAFFGCSSLTSVTIPNSVTSIGVWTFCLCSSLTSVTIPNSVTSIGEDAFRYCSSLTSITIPNSVTSISGSAFSLCSSLTSVTCLKETAPSLGLDVFSGTPSTKTLTVPCESDYSVWESATTWASVERIGCEEEECVDVFTIGDLTYEKTSATEVSVKNCSETATEVIIPASVEQCGITYNVTAIGQQAFQSCYSLTSVVIPNSVTSIELLAFHECKKLTSVTLPNNATINSSAFYHAGEVNIDGISYVRDRLIYVGDYVFEYPGFITFYLNGVGKIFIMSNKVSVVDCDESKSGVLVIPSNVEITEGNATHTYNVTAIGSGAFNQHHNLTSVIIPHGVTTIGSQAFFGCSNLTSVTIPNSVTSIGSEEVLGTSLAGTQAFAYCSSLTSVTIPESVTSIGNSAFYSCSNLTSITCLAETAPSLGSSVFNHTPSDKTLTVSFGSDYSTWQSATTWAKTNYLIQEGKTKELTNDFTINDTTGLINQGVLRITQNGQLINLTTDNVSGIFEVETPTLPTDKWSFVGAPFNGYKLEAIKEGTNDVSVSLFDYGTGTWSTGWATVEDQVGAGEGYFLWSFAAEPTTFTTDAEGETENYTLNNSNEITITKDLTTYQGGNWMALANPYTFKLDVAEFLEDNTAIKQELQGRCVYRLNEEGAFDPAFDGAINLTEGFFVNFANPGDNTATFNKDQRYIATKKINSKKDYLKLTMKDGDKERELYFAQNEEAKQEYDIFDANKLFAPIEITEPYFVTEGNALVKEEVQTLPYTATMNVKSYESKEITFRIDNIPTDINVYLLDNGQDIKMNGGVEYTTNITAGENADRFQILFKKQQKIERAKTNQITIKNYNRHITIQSQITNLNIEVYNSIGQKVLETKSYDFHLDQVPSGSYVVKAYYGRMSQSQKIVIE